jgi:hypothetical protein
MRNDGRRFVLSEFYKFRKQAMSQGLLNYGTHLNAQEIAGVWISLDDQARRKILLLAAGAMSQEE